jgi:RNA polymerase primary sigma factor
MELLDLIQEGMIGLLSALDRWGIEPIDSFHAMACVLIRQSLWLVLYGADRPVHVSSTTRDALSKLKRTERQLSMEFGREPLAGELAQEMQVTEQVVLDLAEWREQGKVASVQGLLRENQTEDYHPFASLYAAVSSSSLSSEALQALHHGLRALPDFQREVLSLRFGLGEHTSGVMTHKDIADHLGTSEVAVAKAERRACQVLKKLLEPVLSGRNQVVPGASCDEYYTPGEVASLLGTTTVSVAKHAKAGKLPAIEYNGVYRGIHVRFLFPKQAIDKLVPARTVSPDAYYTMREVASLLGITDVTVAYRVKAGKLPAIEYNGVYRGSYVRFLFPKQEIDVLVPALAGVSFRGKRFAEMDGLSA